MLEILGGLLDLIGLLVWLPRALVKLWRWLTEERSLLHRQHAADREMATIRWFARAVLLLWLALAAASAVHWWGAWGESWKSFLIGLAIFAVGPAVLVFATGRWRDRAVASAHPLGR